MKRRAFLFAPLVLFVPVPAVAKPYTNYGRLLAFFKNAQGPATAFRFRDGYTTMIVTVKNGIELRNQQWIVGRPVTGTLSCNLSDPRCALVSDEKEPECS